MEYNNKVENDQASSWGSLDKLEKVDVERQVLGVEVQDPNSIKLIPS